jgi:hypothetical protein
MSKRRKERELVRREERKEDSLQEWPKQGLN